MQARDGRPLLLIDLAVPRDIDPGCREVPGVSLHDVDDVQAMVERKVMAFSVDRVEEILRNVIQNELNLIITTGYVLGGLIGVCTFGLQKLLGL